MKQILRARKQIALSLVAPVAGFLALRGLDALLEFEIPRLQASVINLSLVSVLAFVAFPRWLGVPFGRISPREHLRRLGLYAPANWWKHVLAGLLLAACTLSGMLAASWSTARYVTDSERVTLAHLVFSLNPALWEELFYRGVLMFVLLRATGSLRKAAVIQVLLFGLMHTKGLNPWAIVDTLSVAFLAAGFTYVAWKTRTLLAGIVFHYFHDALLFLVQLPEGTVWRATDRVVFYAFLWFMLAAGCLMVKLAAERFGIRAAAELYPDTPASEPAPEASTASVPPDAPRGVAAAAPTTRQG